MTAVQKILINSGILFGYVIFTWLVMHIHADYYCLVTFMCDTEYPGQSWYVIPGRILAFLNLWALVFYVNMDFFRDGPLDIDEMTGPALVSLLWTAVVFAIAIWIMSIGGLLIMGYLGIDLS